MDDKIKRRLDELIGHFRDEHQPTDKQSKNLKSHLRIFHETASKRKKHTKSVASRRKAVQVIHNQVVQSINNEACYFLMLAISTTALGSSKISIPHYKNWWTSLRAPTNFSTFISEITLENPLPQQTDDNPHTPKFPATPPDPSFRAPDSREQYDHQQQDALIADAPQRLFNVVENKIGQSEADETHTGLVSTDSIHLTMRGAGYLIEKSAALQALLNESNPECKLTVPNSKDFRPFVTICVGENEVDNLVENHQGLLY